jgi:hypothetical protein
MMMVYIRADSAGSSKHVDHIRLLSYLSNSGQSTDMLITCNDMFPRGSQRDTFA